MRSRLGLGLLLVGVLAVPFTDFVAPAKVGAQTPPPPSAVEDFAYPGAAQILIDTGIKLLTGDGHFTLADCAGPDQDLVRLYSFELDEMACFKVSGPVGYLALEIPDVYTIRGDLVHDVNAAIEIEGVTSSVDVIVNEWTPVGVGANDGNATLLELVATPISGNVGTLPVDSAHPNVGRLTVGAPGRAGSRGCSATLIARRWVATASTCFVDDPATLGAGAPAKPTSVAFGGHAAVAISELTPRTDRDLVLAKLASPIDDIAPVSIANVAPAASHVLQTFGYGRSATTWLPDTLHSGTATVASVSGATVNATRTAGSICKGDAGGPALRSNGQLAGVVTRSGSTGCLAATQTTNAAVVQRVDDIAQWIVTSTWATENFGPLTVWNDNWGSDGDQTRLGDVNGDGRADAVAFGGSDTNVYVRLSTGTTFGPSEIWHTYFGTQPNVQEVGDVNGDGRDDIIVFALGASHDVYVALSTGTGFGTTMKWHESFGSDGEQVMLGDVDGDGRDDLVDFTLGANHIVYVALSTGTGFGPYEQWHNVFGSDGNQMRVGDVNGDGKDDVVGYTLGPASAANAVWVALSTGSSFGTPQSWAGDYAADGNQVMLGDADGDGKEDAIAFTVNGGRDAWVARSTGSSFEAGKVWHDTFGWVGEQIAVGDLTSDGRADAVSFTLGSTHDIWVGPSGGGQTVTVGTPAVVPGFVAPQVEGNSGSKTVDVAVKLTARSNLPVTVAYSAVEPAGWGTAPEDFDVVAGTLTFTPGQTVKTVRMTIKGDTLDEPDEGVLFSLTNPTNATVGGYYGLGGVTTLIDDDATPVLVASGVSAVVEGHTGTKTVQIPVTLSAASGRTVTVDYAAFGIAGWATAPADYDVVPGTLTFLPGQTSKTVTLTIKGDTLDEPDELAAMKLTNPTNATIGGLEGVAGASITDDD